MVGVYAFFSVVFFSLPALVLWLPALAVAYWCTPKDSKRRRHLWMWTWMLPAAATVIVLGLTGVTADVLGSV